MDSSGNMLRGVITEIIYHTNKESFSPIFDTLLDFLDTEYQNLAVDLLLCSATKGSSRIKDWSLVASKLSDVLRSDLLNSKQLYLLSAIVTAKSDAVTGRTFTKTVFEILMRRNNVQDLGLFCQLVGKLDESCFQTFLLDEFIKYFPASSFANVIDT